MIGPIEYRIETGAGAKSEWDEIILLGRPANLADVLLSAEAVLELAHPGGLWRLSLVPVDDAGRPAELKDGSKN